MNYPIDNDVPLPKKKTKPRPLYVEDPTYLAELEVAMNTIENASRYTEAGKVVLHHMPKLDRHDDDFKAMCRRLVRQYDKKHHRN